MICNSFSAFMVNYYTIMKSSDLNGHHWTVPAFHKLLASITSFFPKYLYLISPTFSVWMEKLEVPVRAEARLPKGENKAKVNWGLVLSMGASGHRDTQRAITTSEAKGFYIGTDLKTGSFVHMRAKKNSLKQWKAEKRSLYMITGHCCHSVQKSYSG